MAGPAPALDLIATPTGQGGGGEPMPSSTPPEAVPLTGIRLVDVAETQRFKRLNAQESFFRRQQDAHKLYTWAGTFAGYGDEQGVQPGFTVPYRSRRPAARYDVATVIVKRHTAMLFGQDRFPQILVQGDPDAEDYARTLATVSALQRRAIEARDLGGAVGSVGSSFAFVNGKPRVEVHNAKHCTVLRWADESDWIVRAVLKTYVYPRLVYNRDKLRMEEQKFFYARYWDDQIEIEWDPIPYKLGETFLWSAAPRRQAVHAFGFTPFYWTQNIADSASPDGEGDYEGLEPNLCEINELLSASAVGTKANVDPTLVIKSPPETNPGMVQKGSGQAIFSEGGAEYLELQGAATKAAIEMLDRLCAATMDVASVVVADPEKLSGAAQSAAALRILYAPQVAQADLHRNQYGDHFLVPLLLGMLRASRSLLAAGTPVLLPPRVDRELPKVEDPVEPEPGERIPRKPPAPPEPSKPTPVERVPGESEEITLNWPPHFAPTWQDISLATTAAQAASGGKPIISQRTATAAVATMFGIADVDAEQQALHEDSERALAQAQAAMPPEPLPDDEGEGPPKKA